MSKMQWGEEVTFYSQLQEKVKSRDSSIILFTWVNKVTKISENYRVWISYSSGRYNLILSYNDYNRWGQTLPGERLPLVTKTKKEDVIEYISKVMERVGFKDKTISINTKSEEVIDFSWKEQEKEVEKVIRYSIEAWEFKVLSYDYDQFERKFRVVFLGDFWSWVDDKASLQEFTNEKTEENEILECIKLTYTKDTFEVYNWQLKITLDWELHIK